MQPERLTGRVLVFSAVVCCVVNIYIFLNRVLRFHGVNERISKQNYEQLVQFYFSLIQNCDARQLPEPHGALHEL